MDETEINLIRQYVHLTYLIKEAVSTIEYLPSSRIALSSLLVTGTKALGKRARELLSGVQKDLRTRGIYVKIEDDGSEVIFICTTKNGVKGRHGMKRRILLEDIAAKLDVLSSEWKITIGDYKPTAAFVDPYARLHS